MASNNSRSHQNRDVSNRNTLIAKIALFLNYIDKKTFQVILKDLNQQENNKNIDILKFMPAKKYISQQDCLSLRKACISFTRMQDDSRFGSLCLAFEFLTQNNLQLALEEQQNLAKTGKNIMLGDILVEAGMISDRQRKLILQKQKLNIVPQKDQHQKNNNTEPEKSNSLGIDTANFREIREADFIFFIQNDALKAFVLKSDTCSESLKMNDFKEALERNGIIYGVVDENRINKFLNSDIYKKRVFELANGLYPIDGVDALIQYRFETDYLKAGKLNQDGTIDFKERGEIPFVQVDDVLAKKTPLKEGKDGVSIFGDAISFVPPVDIAFDIGKNVKLSEDELTVFALVEGNPKLTPGGEISVNDAYYIEGAVSRIFIIFNSQFINHCLGSFL